MSCDGEQVILVLESTKMNFRNRRFLQTLTVAILLAYTILLVYQNFSHDVINNNDAVFPNEEKLQNSLQFPHHSNRELSNDHQNLETPDRVDRAVNLGEVTQVTMRPFSTELNDMFISVKTTEHFHKERLPIILKTWFQLAKNQTWFFTDTDDPEFQKMTNSHMINTNCSSSHSRKALCCKMSVEFDTFIETDKK
ncbi:hypothetical protein WA026_007050 [Henosepilachna vigintioctopunctata]|uniref:Fringe-like glycosyltransferase domain-containing protein n=1 Tax=Henosepilachna vigintioctopunctata TaxID=420089 RepID=A0AAW1V9C6_9CUCU